MPMGEFLLELAQGSLKEFKFKKGFQIGVRILVPPYPFNDPQTFEAYSKNGVILFKKPNLDGVHIGDVKLLDQEWLVAGNSGVALIVVGTGQTMKQAQAQVYHRIANIMIQNMYYRTDIGDRWYEDSDRLHTWGYLRQT